ncbi:TPA: hypothetical protein ACH3X1_014936 [Trebouxia sp. C0004]
MHVTRLKFFVTELATGRCGQSEHVNMTMDMFNSSVDENGTPIIMFDITLDGTKHWQGGLSAKEPLHQWPMGKSGLKGLLPDLCKRADTSWQSGQVCGQIAPLQHSNSYQVKELTESEAPPAAAQSLSSSNDLASVLSLQGCSAKRSNALFTYLDVCGVAACLCCLAFSIGNAAY